MARRVRPFIRGRGAAGQALAHALALFPDRVARPRWVERGQPFPEPRNPERALAVIANPHGRHTPRLLEAAEKGFRYAISEKPVAIDQAQIDQLAELPLETWICHGYRMLWGPRELERAWRAGRLGKVLSIEGRYWQSSAAHDSTERTWKDDPELGGRFDVLLDLATHFADLVTFLAGRPADQTTVRRWYENAASPHRDTHVHLDMKFGDIACRGSVSKTAHGHGNTLEVHVLGEDALVSWSFRDPDLLIWGHRGVRSTQARIGAELPERPGPFHGLGWMEGYARIVGEVVPRILDGRPSKAPTLAEHVAVLESLLEAAAAENR